MSAIMYYKHVLINVNQLNNSFKTWNQNTKTLDLLEKIKGLTIKLGNMQSSQGSLLEGPAPENLSHPGQQPGDGLANTPAVQCPEERHSRDTAEFWHFYSLIINSLGQQGDCERCASTWIMTAWSPVHRHGQKTAGSPPRGLQLCGGLPSDVVSLFLDHS